MAREYRWMGDRQAQLLSVLSEVPRTTLELQAELDQHHSMQLQPAHVLNLLDGLHSRGLVDLVDWDQGHGWYLARTAEAKAAQAHACARFRASQTAEPVPDSSPTDSQPNRNATVVALRSDA